MQWLTHEDLHLPTDLFSATWIQTKDQFLQIQLLKQVLAVEDSSFGAVYKNELYTKVRMPYDWLDFAVEHMSK